MTNKDSFLRYSAYFPFTKEMFQGKVLDVATGDGRFVQYLRGSGLSPDAIGLEKAEHKIAELGEGIVVGDAESLPFGDNH